MAGGDRGLEQVGVGGACRCRVQRLRPGKRGKATADEELVPARPVLIEQQHGLARRPGARPEPRHLDLHERDEPVHFGLFARELGEDAAETQRLLAELGPHPVVAGRRCVALIEDEVDDRQHRGETRFELRSARHFERHALIAQRPLGTNDALLDGRLGKEEGPGDLFGGQAAEQAQRQRRLRLGRQDRVAGDENETEQIVAELVVERCIEIGLSRLLLEFERIAEFLVPCARGACRGGSGRSPCAWRRS